MGSTSRVIGFVAILVAAFGPNTADAHRVVAAQLTRQVSCRSVQLARRAPYRAALRMEDGGNLDEESPSAEAGGKKLGFFARLAQGFDDIVDDALDRKLGNGASFYGKRKSNFYGGDDPMKKKDPRKRDDSEDYKGNAGGSYFIWDKETGLPLTKKQARLKKAGKLVLPSNDDE